jgi:YggT family protein
MFAQVIKILFTCYTFFIFARIIGSWIPQFRNHNIMRFFSYYTDPYLNLFRMIIPPIGGVLDLSPIIALMLLEMVEKFLLSFIR